MHRAKSCSRCAIYSVYDYLKEQINIPSGLSSPVFVKAPKLQPPCPEWLPAALQQGGTEVAQAAAGEPVGAQE